MCIRDSSYAPLHAHPQSPADAKRPPGNRAAFSLGRIVPTEAKPSELSGCILSLAKTGVKAKTSPLQHIDNRCFRQTGVFENIRLMFAFHSFATVSYTHL